MSNLDYGAIGNCRTAALVSKNGDIDWLCFPDFDSSSIFSGLLDAEAGGRFGFVLAEGYASAQEYIPETNVLRTRFSKGNDIFDVYDFMPRYRISATECYMPPEVYRLLCPVQGKPRLRVVYEPVMNYAREEARHETYPGYVLSVSAVNDDDNVYLYSSLDFDDILLKREIALEKDEFLLLAYHQKLVPISLDRVRLELERTKVYWLNWANRSVRYDSYTELTVRSLLVLKLMTYEKTGAILAALTTSIPEAIGEGRNWDYRYCWLRDASMSIDTLLRMGHKHAAQRFLGFIKRIVRSKADTFQIMYGIRGERILEEEELGHLAGFEGSAPVRIGNAAYTQKQNDSFGYLLNVIHSYYRFFPTTLDDLEEMWEIVKKLVKIVIEDWREPDHSIWEFRYKRDSFVFSKVMCWVALDRGARIAGLLGCEGEEARYRAEADAIHEEVLDKGWNEKIQSFSQSYGSADVDSSLLLMEEYGFIAADDERYIKTVDRVKQELLHNGLMYRYKNRDDFGSPTSAFTICTFWLVRALYVTGRKKEAADIFDNVVARCNHVGLFSEDLDFVTKRQLGNFPQAYSHLALIDVTSLLSEKTARSRFIRP